MPQFNRMEFLGRGLSFPPTFDKKSRDLVMVEAAQDIQQSLEILLTTQLGERVLEPNYGANLEQLIFEPLDTSLISLMEDTIKTAILYHEPRIDVHEIRIDDTQPTQGQILIKIDFTIRSTNSRFNFVYPFYIEEGTDINR